MGGVGGHPENPQLSFTGLDIHIVETGAAQSNGLHTHMIELFHHLGIHGVIDEHAHRIKSIGKGDGVPVQVRLIVFDLNSGGNRVAVKAGNVIGLGIKKSKFHNLFLLLISIALY